MHMNEQDNFIEDELDLDEQERQEFSARVQRLIELFELMDTVRTPS